MIPYSFASSYHFFYFISFTVVLGATYLGFIKHSLKFFSLFVPSGCPLGYHCCGKYCLDLPPSRYIVMQSTIFDWDYER